MHVWTVWIETLHLHPDPLTWRTDGLGRETPGRLLRSGGYGSPGTLSGVQECCKGLARYNPGHPVAPKALHHKTSEFEDPKMTG